MRAALTGFRIRWFEESRHRTSTSRATAFYPTTRSCRFARGRDLPGPWGHYVRFLLLTACRKSEAADMTWAELDGDTWVIPAERSKSKTSVALPLSTAARSCAGQPASLC